MSWRSTPRACPSPSPRVSSGKLYKLSTSVISITAFIGGSSRSRSRGRINSRRRSRGRRNSRRRSRGRINIWSTSYGQEKQQELN